MTIAIALAMFNGEKYVYEQLNSLLKQSRVPDKVVICDDCSTDNSVEIVKDFINLHGLQDYWCIYRNDSNIGYIKNFYHAVKLCCTDIVFLCDQDDIWEYDKVERMTEILEMYDQISVLSCRYTIMDKNSKKINDYFAHRSGRSNHLTEVKVIDILSAYCWPGMAMAIRSSFIQGYINDYYEIDVPHDFLIALFAADHNQFWEIDYVGVCHRRHENNLAREEHKITRKLNLQRKLYDLDVYINMIIEVLESNINLSDTCINYLKKRLCFCTIRRQALKERRYWSIIKLYFFNNMGYFRIYSLLSDILMVCFVKCIKPLTSMFTD